MITIRPFAPADAESVVGVHWKAVHGTAVADYAPEILNEWPIPVTPERVEMFWATRATSNETTVGLGHGYPIFDLREINFPTNSVSLQ